MEQQKSIVLVGLMGVGKTTLGRLLSEALQCAFVDIDELIVENEGKTIPEIFSDHGESYFRRLEAETIKQVLDGDMSVVSTGGGAVMTPETADLVWNNSISIWIHSDPDVLLDRIGQDENRPLLQDGDPLLRLQELEKKRVPVYEKADIHIRSGKESLDKTFKKILDACDEFQR